MISRQAEINIEKQIIQYEEILKVKLTSFTKMLNKIEDIKKSAKRAIQAKKMEMDIQQRLKKLAVERDLLKYSPYTKYSYLHNLSFLIGLTKKFEKLYNKLEKNDVNRHA